MGPPTPQKRPKSKDTSSEVAIFEKTKAIGISLLDFGKNELYYPPAPFRAKWPFRDCRESRQRRPKSSGPLSEMAILEEKRPNAPKVRNCRILQPEKVGDPTIEQKKCTKKYDFDKESPCDRAAEILQNLGGAPPPPKKAEIERRSERNGQKHVTTANKLRNSASRKNRGS